MKTAKKKTAKAVKKGPAAGGAPLRLRVGRCYESEEGEYQIRVLKQSENDTSQVEVELLKHPEGDRPWFDMWFKNGNYFAQPPHGRRVMVREVPRPPRARK